jgi:mevalonate kinase
MTSAKLLLFGEYSVLVGSKALAIPIDKFNGEWGLYDYTSGQNTYKESLLKFAEYLEGIALNWPLQAPFDIEQFKLDIEKGYSLKSNIPIGCGLGSSAVLCVELFKTYVKIRGLQKFDELRSAFILMESFFHTKSSGIDPIVSYFNKPFEYSIKGSAQVVQIKENAKGKLTLFLIDSLTSRNTGSLVSDFLKKYDENPTFNKSVSQNLIVNNNEAISALINNDPERLQHYFRLISEMQINNMQSQISENLQTIWEGGLYGGGFQLKICGAGGGGFYLGLTEHWDETKERLKAFRPEKIFLI